MGTSLFSYTPQARWSRFGGLGLRMRVADAGWGDVATCTFLIVDKVRRSLELLSARFVRSAVRAWPRVAHCMRVEPCTGQYRSEATPPLSVFDVVQAPRAIQPLGGSYLVCVVAESVHALRVVIDSSSNHPPTVLASRR